MRHLPHYQPTERTRYRVRVWVSGFEPSQSKVHWIKGKETLRDCQRAYIELRDSLGLGVSHLGFGDVFDERGQHLARISYNGRLWPGLEWHTGMEPLAEAPGRQGAA